MDLARALARACSSDNLIGAGTYFGGGVNVHDGAIFWARVT